MAHGASRGVAGAVRRARAFRRAAKRRGASPILRPLQRGSWGARAAPRSAGKITSRTAAFVNRLLDKLGDPVLVLSSGVLDPELSRIGSLPPGAWFASTAQTLAERPDLLADAVDATDTRRQPALCLAQRRALRRRLRARARSRCRAGSTDPHRPCRKAIRRSRARISSGTSCVLLLAAKPRSSTAISVPAVIGPTR